MLTSYKTLRRLQLEIDIFNDGFAFLIFGIRTGAVGVVTICGFGAVQFFKRNGIIGAINCTVLFDALLLCSIMYDKGFAIPRCFDKMKRSLIFRLKMLKNLTEIERFKAEKQLKSIRTMSIRVGSFHHLQRVSTPTFIDFSVKNVARLVMAFRRRKPIG